MTGGVQRIRFRLALSAETFLHYYRGDAQAVIVKADDGRRIQIPAQNLRRFVTSEGITGHFELLLTADNRFLDIERIS